MKNFLEAVCEQNMAQPLSTITGYGYDTQDNYASLKGLVPTFNKIN
jgi:hypothetical protein